MGLIGDDINAVARKMSDELELPVIPCSCEGFRGVSQSLGHHISNDTIRDYIIETRAFAEPPGPYDVALIGDYNIGGDVWSVRPLLEEIGLQVKATWTGDGELERIAATHQVDDCSDRLMASMPSCAQTTSISSEGAPLTPMAPTSRPPLVMGMPPPRRMKPGTVRNPGLSRAASLWWVGVWKPAAANTLPLLTSVVTAVGPWRVVASARERGCASAARTKSARPHRELNGR